MHFENTWSVLLLNIGSPLLAIGYIAAFSYIFIQFSNNGIFKWFENIGRTSLTNYIMKTVIFVCGYHIGLFKGLSAVSLIFVVLIIFSIQINILFYKHRDFI